MESMKPPRVRPRALLPVAELNRCVSGFGLDFTELSFDAGHAAWRKPPHDSSRLVPYKPEVRVRRAAASFFLPMRFDSAYCMPGKLIALRLTV
jgi:hypothetical protein